MCLILKHDTNRLFQSETRGESVFNPRYPRLTIPSRLALLC